MTTITNTCEKILTELQFEASLFHNVSTSYLKFCGFGIHLNGFQLITKNHYKLIIAAFYVPTNTNLGTSN